MGSGRQDRIGKQMHLLTYYLKHNGKIDLWILHDFNVTCAVDGSSNRERLGKLTYWRLEEAVGDYCYAKMALKIA